MAHRYRTAYKRSSRAARLPIPEGGFRGYSSSSSESALPQTPSEPFPNHPWPLVEDDDDDIVPGNHQRQANNTDSRDFDAKPQPSGRRRFIARPVFAFIENNPPPSPVFSPPRSSNLDGFPRPPTLADIQRMEPDLTPLEQMMRASDVDQEMLARFVNAHKGLSGITTSRTFLGAKPKTVVKGKWRDAQPEPVVPAEATRTPPKPSDDMSMFPAPPTLMDIQRMEPDMPLMQQLMRASDANPEYLKKVLDEEKKKGGVVLARDTIRKTAESISSASSESPSVAAALAKWVVLEFLVRAVRDPAEIFWSFVNSYAYNKALIAVEQIIEILGNNPVSLVHAMVYLQRIFKDLCLDGQEFVSHDRQQQENAVAIIRRVVGIAFLLGLKCSNDDINLTVCDNWARALGFPNLKFLVAFEVAACDVMDWRTGITPESWTSSIEGFIYSVKTFPFPFDDFGFEKRGVLDILTGQQVANLSGSGGRQTAKPAPVDFNKQSNALLRLLDGLTVAYGVMSRPRRRRRT